MTDPLITQRATDAVPLNPATSGKPVKNMQQIEAAAQDFEAMFLSEMMKPMFDGLGPDELFGGGKGEEMFQDMMVQEYGKNMAAAGGVGLAKHVREEMIRIQEGSKQ